MPHPRNVLYFAENALSAIQGGGIVTYAVLKGLPAEQLLGFFEYRNITPVPEYADRFVWLGPWRTPPAFHRLNRLTRGRTTAVLHRRFTEKYLDRDLAFVEEQVAQRNFTPEVVYFAGLSYRYLRLAVKAAERYDIPMVILHMDDWMEVDSRAAGKWHASWRQRIDVELERAAARSLVSTSNSPRLAERLTALTGYRHVAANNCCSDLMPYATRPARTSPNRIPIITYAGAMNRHLQGETLRVLASAITELNAEGTRVQLHIYAPWEFAPEANSVAVPHAVFYKGQVGREQLADIYQRADFLVTTVTYRESNIALFRHSLSTKLSEYLCAGKPVISMGHYDWHLQEYVQDNGCGFSILMDENFSRAKIKEQLRQILATDPEVLARIGRNNRALWERAHDVEVMARATRRAVGLPVPGDEPNEVPRRGALWVGSAEPAAWVPLSKLQAIARRLVDVFHLNAVDIVGDGAASHPALNHLLAYCRQIGLRPTLVSETVSAVDGQDWILASTRWSLAPRQRAAAASFDEPLNVFAQVADLRSEDSGAPTPVQRVINQLSVLVDEAAATRPTVWLYGSAATGREIIAAIEQHRWLKDAVVIGGFASSPGYCGGDMLHGYRWISADALAGDANALIVVASETSRLAIQEQLTRLGLERQAIPAFGMRAESAVYERDASGPGQAFVEGFTARDYAEAELTARVAALCADAPAPAAAANLQQLAAA